MIKIGHLVEVGARGGCVIDLAAGHCRSGTKYDPYEAIAVWISRIRRSGVRGD